MQAVEEGRTVGLFQKVVVLPDGVFIMKNGRVSYVHNWVGKDRYTITAPEQVAAGKATIRYDFAYDGGDKPGVRGTGTIPGTGQQVADGRVGNTTPFFFSAD